MSEGDGLPVPAGPGWGETGFLAVISMIPGFGSAFVLLFQKTLDDDRRRAAQIAAAAQAVVDDDVRFVERIAGDERLRAMLWAALDAGVRTPNEAKRVAMGRVVGRAINDDAQIDDSAALLQALAAFEAPHFVLMAQFQTKRDDASDLYGGFHAPEPYRSALIAQGVVAIGVQTVRPTGLQIMGLNDFGRRLLKWVTEAQATEPPSVS
jgi:hypothetical protein